MGQTEITEYLKSVNGMFKTAKEIAEAIKINAPTVNKCMRRVIKRGEVSAIYVYWDKSKRKIWKYGIEK